MEQVVCLKLGDFEENCYLFSYGNKLCVVDPGTAQVKLIRQIEELCKDNKLTFESIFLTHGHLDHVAGITKLKKLYPDVKVYISEYERQYLGEGSYNFQYKDFLISGMGNYVEMVLSEKSDLPHADVYVKDGDVIFDDWLVMNTSGHTKGSCCLYNENRKVPFSGDTLMFYSYGRTDMTGGSDTDMQRSLQRISQLPKDTIVCPGHENFGFELGNAFLWSYSVK